MKNLFLAALAIFTIQVSAQKKEFSQKNEKQHKMKNISPEEMATIQTKKMTLALDLSPSQQTKIKALNLKNANQRKAQKEANKLNKANNTENKPTQEQRLKMLNTRLDSQIATKQAMKNILDKNQYVKYEKLKTRHTMAQKAKKRARKKNMH